MSVFSGGGILCVTTSGVRVGGGGTGLWSRLACSGPSDIPMIRYMKMPRRVTPKVKGTPIRVHLPGPSTGKVERSFADLCI